MLCIVLTVLIVSSVDAQKPDVAFAVSNFYDIPPRRIVSINSILEPQSGEYLDEGFVNRTFQLRQINNNLSYYLLLFNLADAEVVHSYSTCVKSFYQKKYDIDLCCPLMLACSDECISPATSLKKLCCQGCTNQTLRSRNNAPLSEFISNQNSLLIIYNPNSENLQISVDWNNRLTTSNIWLYWQVVLSCVLVINVVVLTGVSAHMYLKYKKSKEKLMNLQLTETKEQ